MALWIGICVSQRKWRWEAADLVLTLNCHGGVEGHSLEVKGNWLCLELSSKGFNEDWIWVSSVFVPTEACLQLCLLSILGLGGRFYCICFLLLSFFPLACFLWGWWHVFPVWSRGHVFPVWSWDDLQVVSPSLLWSEDWTQVAGGRGFTCWDILLIPYQFL